MQPKDQLEPMPLKLVILSIDGLLRSYSSPRVR